MIYGDAARSGINELPIHVHAKRIARVCAHAHPSKRLPIIFLLLHLTLEAVCIYLESVLAGDKRRQILRETVGII